MYSPEEIKAFEKILADFTNYMESNPYLEIIRSPKFGYCKLVFDDINRWDGSGMLERFQDSEELLDGIYEEILADVRDLEIEGDHKTNQLSCSEAKEICRRVDGIIQNSGKERQYYMRRLEQFLEAYQELWGMDETP